MAAAPPEWTTLLRDLQHAVDALQPTNDTILQRYSALLLKYPAYRRQLIARLRPSDLTVLASFRLKEVRLSRNCENAYNCLTGAKGNTSAWDNCSWSELDIAFGDSWVFYKTFLVKLNELRKTGRLSFSEAVERVTDAKNQSRKAYFGSPHVVTVLNAIVSQARDASEAQQRGLQEGNDKDAGEERRTPAAPSHGLIRRRSESPHSNANRCNNFDREDPTITDDQATRRLDNHTEDFTITDDQGPVQPERSLDTPLAKRARLNRDHTSPPSVERQRGTSKGLSLLPNPDDGDNLQSTIADDITFYDPLQPELLPPSLLDLSAMSSNTGDTEDTGTPLSKVEQVAAWRAEIAAAQKAVADAVLALGSVEAQVKDATGRWCESQRQVMVLESLSMDITAEKSSEEERKKESDAVLQRAIAAREALKIASERIPVLMAEYMRAARLFLQPLS